MNELPFPSSASCRDNLSELDVRIALSAGDDQSVWRAVRDSGGEDRLFQVLSEEAPRLIHRRGRLPTLSELMLVPVIEARAGTVIDNAKMWGAAERCISDAISEWFGGRERRTIFRRVVPYEWVAGWEPSTMQQHLLAATPSHGSLSATFRPAGLQLPQSVPRLGFIALVRTDDARWPQLPPPNTSRDARLRDVIGHALGDGCSADPSEVLPPDQVPAAIVDGLCLWLERVHQHCGIERWAMQPAAARPDAVQCNIHLGSEAASMQFELRRYQVGPLGIRCLARMLECLAPELHGGRVH